MRDASKHCNHICIGTKVPFAIKIGARSRLQEIVGDQGPLKNSGSHIDASHSRQPLVKGERLVRYEVNAVMQESGKDSAPRLNSDYQCA